MAEDPVKSSSKTPSFDPAIQSEDIAFGSDEMIVCGCGRSNPPNRLRCIYCGRELDVDIGSSGAIKASLRPLEPWERGFNVLLTGTSGDRSPDLNAITSCLPLERDTAQAILNFGTPLPVVRVEGANDAAIIERDLEQIGVESMIVSDVDLASDKPPVRSSGLVFGDGVIGVREFNTGKVIEIAVEELIVLVRGILATRRIDAVEKRRRGSTEVVDEAAAMFDEAVLDIYAKGHPLGFRINLAGFDFSCLGDQKELIAGENLSRLMRTIRSHAPNAAFVDNYPKIRHSLDVVWPIESRRSGTGLQRSGFARRDYGSVTLSSNLDQFTRYSRLQRHLHETKR